MGKNYKDPVTGKDIRYTLIRPMYDRGLVKGLRDIFKYIPKTVVARDVRLALDAFNDLLEHPGKWQLSRLFEIAANCGLTEREIGNLVIVDYERMKKVKTRH